MSIRSKAKTVVTLGKAFLSSADRQHVLTFLQAYRACRPARCNCCGFQGMFWTAGTEIRIGSVCPHCGSLERHRLMALALARELFTIRGKRILHFAPEKAISLLIRQAEPMEYVSADLESQRADVVLNIEDIAMKAGSFDLVVASHVLEHVDDVKALSEIYRILGPGGCLIAMVPLIEGWERTFEDPGKTTPDDREQYFGQWDHLRYYGADFRDRIASAGFTLSEFTAGPVDTVDFRLLRGEKVFICRK